jgi:ABC-type amino acid transport/signal transduction systems, periplasmic component/domain
MKKILVLGLVFMMVFAMVPVMAEGDASLEYILNNGKLILGFDASFPPMGFVDEDGAYVGYDLDLAKEVCARLGVELVLQPIDWTAKELELNAKNIDCIWNGMTASAERAASMCLSAPYLENSQVLCVKEDSAVKTLADLAGKVVSVQAASSGSDAVNAAADFKASLKEVSEFSDYAVALMDLDNGSCDAVAIDIIVAEYYIAKKGASYRILEESLSPEQYAIGFRKADEALCQKINDTLLEMANDGALEKITTEWFGNNISIIGK